MTPFQTTLYDRGHRRGDPEISTQAKPSDTVYEIERLDRAVQTLVERYRRIRAENVRLTRAIAEHEQRVTDLESQVRDLNQRRRDVAKRIDDLIGQIDHLETQLSPRSV